MEKKIQKISQLPLNLLTILTAFFWIGSGLAVFYYVPYERHYVALIIIMLIFFEILKKQVFYQLAQNQYLRLQQIVKDPLFYYQFNGVKGTTIMLFLITMRLALFTLYHTYSTFIAAIMMASALSLVYVGYALVCKLCYNDT